MTAPILAAATLPEGLPTRLPLSYNAQNDPGYGVQPLPADAQAATPWDSYNQMQRGFIPGNGLLRNVPMTTMEVVRQWIVLNQDDVGSQFISAPMIGPGMLTGSVKGQVRARMGNSAAGMKLQCAVRVCSYDGSEVFGTAYDGALVTTGTELDYNQLENRRLFPGGSVELDPVSYPDGARLVVEVGVRMTGSIGGTPTFPYYFRWGDDLAIAQWLPEDETSTADLLPWIEFSDTIRFKPYSYDFKTDVEVPRYDPAGLYPMYPGAYEWHAERDYDEQFRVVGEEVIRPRFGTKSMEFTVHPGDEFGGTSGERAIARWFEAREDRWEGQTKWYASSFLIPEDWQAPSGFHVLYEEHTEGDPFSPLPIGGYGSWQIVATQESVYGGVPGNEGLWLNLNTGEDPNGDRRVEYRVSAPIRGTLSKGLWNDLVWRVRWEHEAIGEWDLWHRVEGQTYFVQPVRLRGIPTLNWRMIDGDLHIAGLYLTNGLYRNAGEDFDNVVYQSDYLRGDTFDSVNAWGAAGGLYGPVSPPSHDRNRWS
jgi:hypothetical protein